MTNSKSNINESNEILSPIIDELHNIQNRINALLKKLGDDIKDNDDCKEDDLEIVEIERLPESKAVFNSLEDFINEYKTSKGKCPSSGCVKKVGNNWRVISNKTGKLWPQHYDTREDAEDALAAYHIH
ncbi:MAG: hypothetical protein RSE41_09465 [Clostridia bacterium]